MPDQSWHGNSRLAEQWEERGRPREKNQTYQGPIDSLGHNIIIARHTAHTVELGSLARLYCATLVLQLSLDSL